ncbi:MAG: hypothetical protein BWY53_00635 [Parcubacteria group bacterium ADurb.Bin326]|nr:MAG: hypothetical protein BWY53_00635 [Parcubacteria group bacterium ADurb.Bin326]
MDNKSTNNEQPRPEIIKVEGREIKPAIKNGRPNIVIGTLNIIINPARRRYHRFYKPQANQLWYLHLIIDSILLIAMIVLTAFNVWLATHRPQDWIIPAINWQQEQQLTNQEVPHLKLELQSSEEILDPGEKFSLIINYKNEGKSTAKDAVITLDLNGEFWQGKNKIIWNSNELPRLKEIKPGESGQIKFDGVLAKKFEPQSDSQTKFALIAQVESQYVGEASATEKMTSLSNKEIIKISTEFKVNAFSRYYSSEDEQLGRGPMPPAVGQVTRLWVFFGSETDYNDVSDIIVTGKLADNAELTGNMSATSERGVDFNPASRLITWKISRLSAPAKFYPETGVAFEVALTPNQNQIGQAAIIVSDIKASGKDVFTGKSFNLSLPDVTSLTLEGKTDGKVRAQ